MRSFQYFGAFDDRYQHPVSFSMVFLETSLSLGTGEIQTVFALEADVSGLFVYSNTLQTSKFFVPHCHWAQKITPGVKCQKRHLIPVVFYKRYVINLNFYRISFKVLNLNNILWRITVVNIFRFGWGQEYWWSD